MRAPRAGSANAPAIAEGGEPHIRGVSDPNAQFMLVDRARALGQTSLQVFASAAACNPSSLQVYEAAATIDGLNRALRLAIKNLGDSECRLSGSPSIALQDQTGATLAGIAVRQADELNVSEVVAAPAAASTAPPSLDVVLRPAGEASFEIRWLSGDDCPLVSRIAISVASPGQSKAAPAGFSIGHPLRVCGGELRITPLLAGSSV